MQRWFLSYNSQDMALVQGVADALKRKNPHAQIFFAPKSLRAGGYWLPALAQAIADADAFVLLIGEKGIGPWQLSEYYEAYDRRVKTPDFPLVLVLLEGQSAPGLPFLRQLHWITTSDPASEESIARLMAATGGGETRPADPWRYAAPYRGLAAMAETDSDFFFGRARETTQVLKAIEAAPHCIAVLLGNSGVGKSSLAQAGVIGALKRQAWPDGTPGGWPAAFHHSRYWCFLKFQPGAEPLKALVDQFLRTWQYEATDPEWEERQNGWIARLLDGRATLRGLMDATERRHAELGQPNPPAFFLYVDQGEELYVRADESQRRRFSELLADGISDHRLRAILSLRSDFLGALQNDEPLYAVHQKIDVPPLRASELREVVSLPAERLSARFETDGLVEVLTRRTAEDSVKDAGALPLLSYTLDDMWAQMVKRGDGVLRLPAEAFEPGGVLADRANAFLASRPDAEDRLRRILTLKLATVREDGEPTRRRALRSEFTDEEWRLVSGLADHPHRLLVTVAPDAGETYAEVAHEAIFRRWDRLREWVAAEREFLIWMSQLETDRRRWAAAPASSKQDALLMGLALAEAQRWLGARRQDLPTLSREFIELSLARERVERAQRRRHELRRRLTAAAAALLLTLGIAGGLYWWDRFERDKSAYYAAIVWRWGLPEGVGRVDDEARAHRETTFHVTAKGGKVRQVRRENSAGTLRGDDNGVARWDVVYRENGAADRVRLFTEEGQLVREEVFAAHSNDSASIIFVGSEGAKSQEAMLPGFRAFAESEGEVKNRGEVTRNRLIFDSNGFAIEKRYENQFGAALPNVFGSFGQRFTYSPAGLMMSQEEIDRDGNAITLKNGVHRVSFEYDEMEWLVRQTLIGNNGRLITGDDGYASFSKEYDRWGNLTALSYFGRDGRPTADKKSGVPMKTLSYDEHGAHVRTNYLGFNGSPMLNTDGCAKIGYAYDALGREIEALCFGADDKRILGNSGYAGYRVQFDQHGNVVGRMYVGVDGNPTLQKTGYAGYRQKFDDHGNLVERVDLDTAGNPTLRKDGYAKSTTVYDSHGNVIERDYFGVDGQPILRKDGAAKTKMRYDGRGNLVETTNYGLDGRPTVARDLGAATIKIVSDERGNEIERSYFDAAGNPTPTKDGYALFRSKYDEFGRLIETSYFGVDGKPTLHKDGYASVHLKYDERGNRIEGAGFGVDGKPALHKDGYALSRAKYDERGNKIEEAYFGIDGQPALHREGYASVRRKYDERSNEIEVALFGRDGQPTLVKEGYAGYRIRVDERGNQIEWSAVGLDGKPTLIADGYAGHRSKYDERGNKIEEAYFGIDGQPALHKEGYASVRRKYDERSNEIEVALFGRDGQPVLVKEGYAAYRLRFDERGNRIEWSAIGFDGKPTLTVDGYAVSRSKYDERGNEIERSYFDVAGKLTLHKDGNASARGKFDERGNQIEWAAFGIDGRPTSTADGYAVYRSKYDDRGNEIERSYFGVDGQSILHKEGYAGYRRKFDERGNLVEVTYFGVDGRPMNLEDNEYSIVRQKFDERGNLIEVAYFGADGNPLVDKQNGFSIIRQVFDDRGNVVGEAYFGADGKPTLNHEGYTKKTFTYNQSGERMEAVNFIGDYEVDLRAIEATEQAGTYDKVVKLYEGIVAATEQAEIGMTGKAGRQTARVLGNLAWYAVLAGSFEQALAASERSRTLDPKLLAEANRAHALLFLNRVEEARAIYSAHRGERMPEVENKTWEQAISDDFVELRKAGLVHRLMPEIEAKLGLSSH